MPYRARFIFYCYVTCTTVSLHDMTNWLRWNGGMDYAENIIILFNYDTCRSTLWISSIHLTWHQAHAPLNNEQFANHCQTSASFERWLGDYQIIIIMIRKCWLNGSFGEIGLEVCYIETQLMDRSVISGHLRYLLWLRDSVFGSSLCSLFFNKIFTWLKQFRFQTICVRCDLNIDPNCEVAALVLTKIVFQSIFIILFECWFGDSHEDIMISYHNKLKCWFNLLLW